MNKYCLIHRAQDVHLHRSLGCKTMQFLVYLSPLSNFSSTDLVPMPPDYNLSLLFRLHTSILNFLIKEPILCDLYNTVILY
mmetsp:Transcript_3728/g.500  ORF Transcript_3728/g.500 Transcript_3728/m.500 type:complete len:81 (-) Transcript_3728:543-785(-)